MFKKLKIGLAQLNFKVGDVRENTDRILVLLENAQDADLDLIVFPELCLSGYPPEDLIYRNSFLDRIETAIKELADYTAKNKTPGLLVGAPVRQGRKRFNSAVLIDKGEILATSHKHELPNYGVFDEARVFDAGPLPLPVFFRGARLGIMICEDMWRTAVAQNLADEGAEILVALNGSPFELNKAHVRIDHASARVLETGLPLIYVNLVGGQDELVFDGGSFVLDGQRTLKCQMPQWAENMVVTDWESMLTGRWSPYGGDITTEGDENESIYQAMVLGLRDYVDKNGFPGVVIGMSGGVDSALSAAVAVDALGADRVRLVMMPSPYTSSESLDDASKAGELLGTGVDSISIEPAMHAFASMLSEHFSGTEPDTTEENIQARARGVTLMALSNKFGHMVLSTGNKSEMSVGYATLYGDMCGGFSVLKDVYKTKVYELCNWRNKNFFQDFMGPDGAVMPERIITKAPTAELKLDQKDQDSLPPYDQLDDILTAIIEKEWSIEDIVQSGHDKSLVLRIWQMLHFAEYKRRQAPPGVKITSRSFGRERRYPITNAYGVRP